LSNRAYNSLAASDLGVLKGTFGVKLGFGYFLPHAVLLLAALIGFAIWWNSNAGWQRYVSFFVFLLLTAPLIFALWKTLPRLRDTLSVYDNGFIYLRGRETFVCRWDEVKEFDSVVDTGNRPKITAVQKHSGEKIVFAYKMRGLDLLDHEYFEYSYAKIPDSEKARPEDLVAGPTTLGALCGTFHSKFRIGNIWPIFLLMFPAFMGVAAVFAVPDMIGKVLCSIPAIFPLCIYVWSLFSERRDEMKIFESGFSYRHNRQITECLWEQIEDYSVAGAAFAKLPDDLASIKKQNGPWIPIAMDMQGKELLEPHLRTILKEFTGPEK